MARTEFSEFKQIYNAFEQACIDGDLEKTKALRPENINYCIDPMQSYEGETPLILAIRNDRQDIVKYLLEEGADPNLQNEVAQDLHYYLMRDGVRNVYPLITSMFFSSVVIVEMLIQFGAAVNVKSVSSTPLSIAAFRGGFQKVDCLLRAGADPNFISDYAGGVADIPIHGAAFGSDIEIIKRLCDAGANVNVVNMDGETALFWIQAEGVRYQEILDELIKRGLDLSIKSRNGKTALSKAEGYGQLERVELLKSYMHV
jgi:ankyrin repeat protein